MRTSALPFALLLLLPVTALAQSGTVTYQETVQLDIELPPEMAHMRDQIPSERSSRSLLAFDGERSLMKLVPDLTPDVEQEEDGRRRRMRMRIGQIEAETFTDRSKNLIIEQRTFLQRTFLIADEATPIAWRLTDQRAEFLGLMAIKATARIDDDTDVEAWFTPEIPVPLGPSRYGGLPGLILVLTENDGRRTFVAEDIVLDQVLLEIERPTRGREVTREEFTQLVEERMQELGGRGGRGGVVRFRVQE